MVKWISAAVAGIIGATLAAFAAWGVVSSNTAAPSHNPADAGQIVTYGDR
ncbi:Protein of unknown function [Jatrophihabitans endophyticus]|uniref:SipW-cognate class signal peptide n=1 Tax=Jatrophihabitans endophyticus TaxID=1206085 RepID=A0A1M5CXN2_9ACTN|nr:DUF2613 family protein [Jatrophihabitans endophyticus]SHF59469.1 Protein of unknown function [Jatrophihabitans endophyticus]